MPSQELLAVALEAKGRRGRAASLRHRVESLRPWGLGFVGFRGLGVSGLRFVGFKTLGLGFRVCSL